MAHARSIAFLALPHRCLRAPGRTAPAARTAPQRYSLTDLGALPGDDFSYAADINDRGQAAGVSYSSRLPERAFLWETGKLTPLGTLGGAGSVAHALNNRGQVTGESNPAPGIRRAFLWEAGRMTDLGTLDGRRSRGYGINNEGEVVGIRDQVHLLWCSVRRLGSDRWLLRSCCRAACDAGARGHRSS